MLKNFLDEVLVFWSFGGANPKRSTLCASCSKLDFSSIYSEPSKNKSCSSISDYVFDSESELISSPTSSPLEKFAFTDRLDTLRDVFDIPAIF